MLVLASGARICCGDDDGRTFINKVQVPGARIGRALICNEKPAVENVGVGKLNIKGY